MSEEKVLIHYKNDKTYTNTAQNAVGATTSTTLRTVTAYNDGNCLHVKKFGSAYLATDITGISAATPDLFTSASPGDRLTITLADVTTGTVLGYLVETVDGAGNHGKVFVDAGTVATGSGIKIRFSSLITVSEWTVATYIDVTTDLGTLRIYLPREYMINGDNTPYWYCGSRGDCWYDSIYKHGGQRVPDANLGTAAIPFYSIEWALTDPNATGFDIITVLDSESYEIEENTLNNAWTIQAALGQTPTLTNGIGARVTREISLNDGSAATDCFRNYNSVFWNENGNNGTAVDYQSWQLPYLTINAAYAAIIAGGVTRGNVIYGGLGATVTGFKDSNNSLIDADINLESDYGYTPEINNYITLGDGVKADAVSVNGFIFNGGLLVAWGIKLSIIGNYTGYIQNCTIERYNNYGIGISDGGGCSFQGEIRKCLIQCNQIGIDNISELGETHNGFIRKNIIRNNNAQGIYSEDQKANSIIKIHNNLIINNGTSGIHIVEDTGDISFEIKFNTIVYNTTYGIYLNNGVGDTIGTVSDNIIYENTTKDLYAAQAGQSITDTNYETNTNWTIGAGCYTTDPAFINITNNKYAVKADSPNAGYNFSGVDNGFNTWMLDLSNNDIIINGFIIDGQNQYNKFVNSNTAASGDKLKWCTIKNFQGMAIDIKSFTNFEITNCYIYMNGEGLSSNLSVTNNFAETIFAKNYYRGIYSNTTSIYTMNHCVFQGNYIGIDNAGTGIGDIKNSIFSENSLYGIDSNSTQVLTYCGINDSMNNVDSTSTTNQINDPKFISTVDGSENYHLKTVEEGYNINSWCKDASDDTSFPDIGAYDLVRIKTDDTWKYYQFIKNPDNINLGILSKGLISNEDGLGDISLYAKAHKRVVPMNWTPSNSMTETQRKKLEYFVTLTPTRENGLTKDQCKFRIHFVPTGYLLSGTGTFDATAKTMTDATKTWTENELKGFWISKKYTSGTGTGTFNSGAKTLTIAPSPGWTNDQWIGYWVYYEFAYYYISDNTADVLTLSDPHSYMGNDASINWSIEKYFRVLSNTATVATLQDLNNELVTGSYSYYVDFIECRLQKSEINYTQLPRFMWSREFSKSGQQVIFEES